MVRSLSGMRILIASFLKKPSGLPVAATALPVLTVRASLSPAVILSLPRLWALVEPIAEVAFFQSWSAFEDDSAAENVDRSPMEIMKMTIRLMATNTIQRKG